MYELYDVDRREKLSEQFETFDEVRIKLIYDLNPGKYITTSRETDFLFKKSNTLLLKDNRIIDIENNIYEVFSEPIGIPIQTKFENKNQNEGYYLIPKQFIGLIEVKNFLLAKAFKSSKKCFCNPSIEELLEELDYSVYRNGTMVKIKLNEIQPIEFKFTCTTVLEATTLMEAREKFEQLDPEIFMGQFVWERI